MSQNLTRGFDILIQMSEAEINRQIAARFASGSLFPPLVVPFDESGARGTVNFNFGVPAADLDVATPHSLRLIVPFADSVLRIQTPVAVDIAPLAGTITIVDQLEVRPGSSGTSAVVLDFTNGIGEVAVVLTADSHALLAQIYAILGITPAQFETRMSARVETFLRTNLRRIAMTPDIPTNPGNELPTAVTSFEVGTVNDPAAADGDCVVFGVRTSAATGGNINAVTASLIPANRGAMMLLGNDWLLFRNIRPRLAASLAASGATVVVNGRPVTAAEFAQPCTLNRALSVGGVQIDTMRAEVVGFRIRFSGTVSTSGTGWNADGNFELFLSIGLGAGGTVTVTPTTPTVSVDVDIEWWVYVLGIVTGGAILGGIGLTIGFISVLIADAIADSVADGFAASALAGTGAIAPVTFPLGFGTGIAIDTVLLDDLQLSGDVIPTISMPIRSSGATTLALGAGLDLDTGVISPVAATGTNVDLRWTSAASAAALSSVMPAAIAAFSRSYAATTLSDLQRLPYAQRTLPTGVLPVVPALQVPATSAPTYRFAVRTSEGRYAKCRANVDSSLTLYLEWVTYDTPTASLEIAGRWEKAEIGATVWESGPPSPSRADVMVANHSLIPGIRSGGQFGYRELAWRGHFVAQTRLLAWPIDFEWCVAGHRLAQGDTTVLIGATKWDCTVDRDQLTVLVERGRDAVAEICVSAIDGWTREFFTCVHVHQSGVEAVSDEVIVSTGRLRDWIENMDTRWAAGADRLPELAGPIGPDPVARADVSRPRNATEALVESMTGGRHR